MDHLLGLIEEVQGIVAFEKSYGKTGIAAGEGMSNTERIDDNVLQRIDLSLVDTFDATSHCARRFVVFATEAYHTAKLFPVPF